MDTSLTSPPEKFSAGASDRQWCEAKQSDKNDVIDDLRIARVASWAARKFLRGNSDAAFQKQKLSTVT